MMQHRFCLVTLLLGTILTVGFDCRGDQADWISEWFSGKTVDKPSSTSTDSMTSASSDITPSDNDVYPGIDSNTNTETTQPETSILEDLYPERYGNTNTTPSETSILEDLYPERYGTNFNSNTQSSTTSLWVHETDIMYNEDATAATWRVQIVEGSDSVDSDQGIPSVSVIVEFQNTTGAEQSSAVTDDNGWATWTRPKETVDTQMFIIDIQGGFSWNALDAEFWSRTPALSVSASEWTVTTQ